MARRRSKILSQREVEVMNAVWKLGQATVREVRAELGGDDAGAYTSIATMLKFLEKKGALKHQKDGRTYIYVPTTSKERAQKEALKYVLESFFEGNSKNMADTLIQLNNLSHDRILQLKDNF